VLVNVRAAAVNPADLVPRASYGADFMDAWFPVVPGWDVAGIVERVGAGVSELAGADEVIGCLHNDLLHSGTYAEKVGAPADRFVKKPNALDWTQATALPLAGLTAWQAVTALKPQARETLLVRGTRAVSARWRCSSPLPLGPG
jgi:NADPH:quinone reductase-like Zn-dependent oxidoreductase